jgi:hypothetical protein
VQLHHQPTPETVQNAERTASANAVAALDRARQADADGSPIACVQALDEAKHHWIIPAYANRSVADSPEALQPVQRGAADTAYDNRLHQADLDSGNKRVRRH